MRIALLLCLVGQVASAATPRNVILVMFDGVRHEEFFGKPDPLLAGGDKAPIFPWFWSVAAPRGIVYGKPNTPLEMHVGNTQNLSLPGYQSIFAGRTQPCSDNDCGRIGEDTFAERLVQDLKLAPKEVATIASWDHIPLAVERKPGTTYINAGLQIYVDDTHNAEIARLNARQLKEVPDWKEARFDRFTYAFAQHYLKQQKPRFLFLSLNDSDEWGHLGNYAEYLRTLRQYDTWLKELRITLDGMGDYGKETCFVVTTDHGRGTGSGWKRHGPIVFHSENVWLYTDCLGTESTPRKYFSHLDIRPTIEGVFGLTPHKCHDCGEPLIARK